MLIITAICVWAVGSTDQLKKYALNLKEKANTHLQTMLVGEELDRESLAMWVSRIFADSWLSALNCR